MQVLQTKFSLRMAMANKFTSWPTSSRRSIWLNDADLLRHGKVSSALPPSHSETMNVCWQNTDSVTDHAIQFHVHEIQ